MQACGTRISAISIAVLSSLSTASAFASLGEQPGFSGEVSVVTGYSKSDSNLNTDNSELISSLNGSDSSESNSFVAPLGNLAYTFGSQQSQQVFIGTTREDVAVGTLAIEMGYRQMLSNKTVISLSYLPTVLSGNAWQDPYLVGSNREKTDVSGNAYRLQLKDIAASGISLDVAYGESEYDEEHSGSDLKELERAAKTLYSKLSYKLPLSRSAFLLPSIKYVNQSAEGDAMSYSSLGAELSLFKVLNQHQFVLTASYTNDDYDTVNTLFNKTRTDDQVSLFVAYEYKNLFSYNNLSLISFISISEQSSNIEFYESSERSATLGLNYAF
ncbi:MAG: DUF2860 domain-containing protein [Aliivibrio sp.]|uniref:DUF2860 domain-containing protein n=1 Tax=Aliivibrio sp. TaxID=1872443 RepID=UPI001A60F459|nr:DUF2860 domain-containing protein [Aliivibrio sp.]